MCGICGFLNASETEPVSREILERMVAALAHRGPDSSGFHLDGPLGLGNRRLSIIDLAGGHQPLYSENRSVVLTCNGEIYNYKELRANLLKRGHRFQTKSDCEVLIHLWEDQGVDFVKQVRGMFAFVLYDYDRKVLFGARDRFGQKPLYYHWDGRDLGFASEIKGLLPFPRVTRSLNIEALDQYLFYQFVPQPHTIFKDICQLPPAHYFLVQEGEFRLQRYWEPPSGVANGASDDYHLQSIESALRDSVACHLVSDVPVGIFLSGGIDSSLIAAIATRLSTRPLLSFSISFPETKYDEAPFARMASKHLRTQHQEFRFEPGDISTRITELTRIFDQPLADPAAMPLLILSEHTSQQVKAVLTGDGGDELFAGYEKYRPSRFWMTVDSWLGEFFPDFLSPGRLARCAPDPLRLNKLFSRLALTLRSIQQCAYFKNFWEAWHRYNLYSAEVKEQLRGDFEALDASLDESRTSLSPMSQMLYLDQVHYLPDDLLLKTDYATMAHGLEARAPFLDHHVADAAAKLPDRLKASRDETKIILRRLGEKLLPSELVKRPKRGFGVPLVRWFRNELSGWIQHTLLETSATVPLYFQRSTVERVLMEHISGKRNHAKRIYSLLIFELWHRHYID